MIRFTKYFPYLAIAIISLLFYRQCNIPLSPPEITIKEKIIKIPEIKNHFDTITILKPFKQFKIDSAYKNRYLMAKDSLERLNLYLSAITVKEYNQNFTDSTQSIDVWTKSRGELLAQTLKYKIFERQIINIDTIKLPKSRRTIHLGFETSTKLDLKASLLYTDRKKTIYSVGINPEKTVFVGISIPLLK
jgi:hypothetical protein